MKFFLLFFVLIFVFIGCGSAPIKEDLNLELNKYYPRWIKSDENYSQQTSGISFLKDDGNNEYFLLADDIGKIHHLEIKSDTIFTISDVYLNKKVQSYLDTFPKADFEDLAYDKFTGNIYLSIEGNNPDPKKFVGIYKLTFKNNNIFSDTITNIEKLNIQPKNLFLKYVKNNIGYEGLAVDKNYFYLGLEGFTEEGIFADSTIIFIVDKKSLQIIKEINTKPFGIHTICGLYSDKDFSIYGIDRNNKKIFHINFNNSLDVKDYSLDPVHTHIPKYNSYDYVASLESITMDDKNNLFLTDDPWKRFFIPSKEILSKLDSTSVSNFKNFIPVLYKFKLQNK